MIDSFSEVGWGVGHTFYPPQLPFPIQRIDYVWHSEDFRATQAYVGEDGGSDHLPIVAKLRLRLFQENNSPLPLREEE